MSTPSFTEQRRSHHQWRDHLSVDHLPVDMFDRVPLENDLEVMALINSYLASSNRPDNSSPPDAARPRRRSGLPLSAALHSGSVPGHCGTAPPPTRYQPATAQGKARLERRVHRASLRRQEGLAPDAWLGQEGPAPDAGLRNALSSESPRRQGKGPPEAGLRNANCSLPAPRP